MRTRYAMDPLWVDDALHYSTLVGRAGPSFAGAARFLPPPPQQQHPPRFFTGAAPPSAAAAAASSSAPGRGWIRRETSCPARSFKRPLAGTVCVSPAVSESWRDSQTSGMLLEPPTWVQRPAELSRAPEIASGPRW